MRRLGLDFLDLIYCHRPDSETPIEETVFAMHDIITSGRALYWGTSEWSADAITEAWDIADRHHLHKPIVEQPQYNLFERNKVEKEFAPLYDRIGLGLTTWSPLASGLLTGKYSRRRSRREPCGTARVRVAHRGRHQSRREPPGAGVGRDCRRARGQRCAAFDRVVRIQPARLDA